MTEEYSYELKIPKERIAVLIGKKGIIKKELEEETKTKIDVDSKEGEVTVSGKDAISLFSLREIIRAISRGFNPDTAKLLLKTDYCFEIISLNDIADTKNDLVRIKGRIIGSEGKARKLIEDLTECHICVYGKTISIIGGPETVAVARRAVEQLLKGSTHSSVYKWLEKKRSDLKRKEILGENIELKEGMEKYADKD